MKKVVGYLIGFGFGWLLLIPVTLGFFSAGRWPPTREETTKAILWPVVAGIVIAYGIARLVWFLARTIFQALYRFGAWAERR